MRTRYRIEELGGIECYIVDGVGPNIAGVLVELVKPAGMRLGIARPYLTEIPPLLPEEPPVTSFVNAGSRVLHRRDDHGIDWYDLASGTWFTWAQVCELGTPVRLIPAPVPVALPWASEVSLGRRVGVSVLGGGPVIAIENADGSGSISCHVNAREMVRALNTAAEATS